MADLTPGVPSALSPLVRRIVAPNPGPFTGPGTNTYLVGIDEVAVIDPGPDDQSHIDAIVGASMRERVRWVVLTHTHPDHAPGTERLVKATGAEVLAYGKRIDKDASVVPDRVIGEGDTIEGTEFGLDVLHTPGHAPNHLCFLLEEERVLFTGDNVLSGMFSVINPARGGDMAVYLATLARMEKLRVARLCPGHGDVIEEPRARIQEYIAAPARPGTPGAARAESGPGTHRRHRDVALWRSGTAPQAGGGGRLAGACAPGEAQGRGQGHGLVGEIGLEARLTGILRGALRARLAPRTVLASATGGVSRMVGRPNDSEDPKDVNEREGTMKSKQGMRGFAAVLAACLATLGVSAGVAPSAGAAGSNTLTVKGGEYTVQVERQPEGGIRRRSTSRTTAWSCT